MSLKSSFSLDNLLPAKVKFIIKTANFFLSLAYSKLGLQAAAAAAATAEGNKLQKTTYIHTHRIYTTFVEDFSRSNGSSESECTRRKEKKIH